MAKQRAQQARVVQRRRPSRGHHSTEDTRVISDFVGFLILVELFDADPDRWLAFLRTQASSAQHKHDLPFVLWVKQRATVDPGFLTRIRCMVEEFRHLTLSSQRISAAGH